MESYEKYKPSGIEWIGDIPEHWNIKRLKFLSLVQPSNVDKKSVDDEIKVSLCNYVDVYKNEFIDGSINFMEATATESEIEKFRIKRGDVLVTKDSETAEDIANPAFVKIDLENVVCAYHLTQIRPNRKELFGEYLFRLFQADRYRGQFQVNANGVTRFGLSVASFSDAFVPLPPPDEQIAVSRYLDEKTGQIDKLILNKQRLIELLKEERVVIINQSVTKGISQAVKLKSTDIGWLGEIPAHWTQSRIGHIARVVRGSSPRPAGDPQLFNGNHTPWITVAELTKDNNKFLTGVQEYLSEEGSKQSRFVESGTLLLSNSGATLGVPKILRIGGCINDGSVAFLNLDEKVFIDFLYYFFRSHTDIFRRQVSGYGKPNLNTDIVKETVFCYPQVEEQKQIVQFIETRMSEIDLTLLKIVREIELMLEYRAALISETVTGNIKVV